MSDKLWYGLDEAWLSGVEARLAAAPGTVLAHHLLASAPADLARAVADLRKMEAEIGRQDKLLVQHAVNNERLKTLLREALPAVEPDLCSDGEVLASRIRKALG